MGFELFLESFGDTKKSGLPKTAVQGLFPVMDPAANGTYWQISYGPNNGCDIDIGHLPNDSERLAGLCVHRPCGDIRLWESLFTILKMGSMVLFFPGGPPILAEGTSVADLPSEMTNSIGEPVFVTSAEAILQILREC